jgi:hypothetical protein
VELGVFDSRAGVSRKIGAALPGYGILWMFREDPVEDRDCVLCPRLRVLIAGGSLACQMQSRYLGDQTM